MEPYYTRAERMYHVHGEHGDLGIQIDEKNPNCSQCIRCGACDGFPCLVRAKADAQVLAVDPALEFPSVTLLTNAFAERLETIPSGRAVSKVIVRRNGGREEYSAGVVAVSAPARWRLRRGSRSI